MKNLSELGPIFSAAILKLASRRPVASAVLMAEVKYEDGGVDTLELSGMDMLALALADKAPAKTFPSPAPAKAESPKAPAKAKTPAKAKAPKASAKNPAPAADAHKGFSGTKRVGKDTPESEWLGTAEYLCQSGWKPVALLSETKAGDKWWIARIVEKDGKRFCPANGFMWHTLKENNPKLQNVQLRMRQAA